MPGDVTGTGYRFPDRIRGGVCCRNVGSQPTGVFQLCGDALEYEAFDVAGGDALRWRRWGIPVDAHIISIAEALLARMCTGELLTMMVEEQSGQEVDVFRRRSACDAFWRVTISGLNTVELLPFDDGGVLGRIALVFVPDFTDVNRVLQNRAEMSDAEWPIAPASIVAGGDKRSCSDAVPVEFSLEVADAFQRKETIKDSPDNRSF